MSIQSDDNDDTGLSDRDAVSQLMAKFTGKSARNEAADDEDDDDLDDADEGDEDEEVLEGDDEADDVDEEDGESDDDEEEEGDEDDADDEAEEDEAAKAATEDQEAADDHLVKVTVDGQETTFKVGDLKRLAGQEASLTRKSQEADLVGNRAATALAGALESVLEDLEPYEGVDWLLESRTADPDEFAWHRQNHARLTARRDKLLTSVQEMAGDREKADTAAYREHAETNLKVLRDPKDGIEGFDEKLFDAIKAYGKSQGIPEKTMERMVDAPSIKLIHKAMMFDKGKAAVTEKVNAAPKKVRKTAGREASAAPAGKNRILEKKVSSGRMSDKDAVSALMGRWTKS